MPTTQDPSRPYDLVVLGHVTRDLVRGEERLGGAAAFAALAAASFGLKSGLVTAGPPDLPLFAPLFQSPNLTVVMKPCHEPTTFELDYTGPKRRVRLVSRAPNIAPADVPAEMRVAPLAYIGPVCGECGSEVAGILEARSIIVGAQGWLRGATADGTIVPALTLDAIAPPDGIFTLSLSELDHPDAEALAKGFAEKIPVVAVTRGARGATLYAEGTTFEVPASPAEEKDPTGAGDVFGLVLGLAMHHGVPLFDAGRLATQAAARVVEGPGMGRLADFASSPEWQEILAT